MQSVKNTILVVDDQNFIRQSVIGILEKKYNVIEASNGSEAVDVLEKKRDISLVLLDLIMPGMSGFTFMQIVKEIMGLDCAVIVFTTREDAESEIRAFKCGAVDFIKKPVNDEVLMYRIERAMTQSRLAQYEKLQYFLNHDALTGLYNRKKVFDETRRMLAMHPDRKFVFVKYDVDRFSLYNSAMGEEEGDKLLVFIAEQMYRFVESIDVCTFGRVDADVFCLCIPDNSEYLDTLLGLSKDYRTKYREDYVIDATFGVYRITDITENVEAMYTKASMASANVKHLYGVNMGYFEDEMSDKILQQQWVIKEMKHAIEKRQFQVYLQPKYELRNNTPKGAEALVRWIHPERGMISPGIFIPVFEKNGFIANLDYYMWERVCILIRGWLDKGINVEPISVNISRISLYNPKLTDIIVELIHKYNVPSELLYLEVTESAYMSNPSLMKETLDKLHEAGFVLLMDDFGSGYSSLNTLKEIDVDILKVDMKFLPDGENDVKSEKILSSIIRMAGWLGMPVIAEGVETFGQKEYLRSIGCGYVQGYYYAKPMPVDEYEQLISNDQSHVDKINETVAETQFDAIWSSKNSIEETMNKYNIPIAVYEYAVDYAAIVRVNRAYIEEFDYHNSVQNIEEVSPEHRKLISDTLKKAVESDSAEECQFSYVDKSGIKRWLNMKTKMISKIEKSCLLCCSFTNITKEKLFESQLEQLTKNF